MTERIRVFEAAIASGSRVDREARIIRDVAVLGPTSANGRDYSAVLESAVPLYENAKVYANHITDGEAEARFGARNVDDLRGVLKGAKFHENKIRADLHVLPGESGDRILSLAENHPDTGLGLSHDIDGRGYMEAERLVMESIERVHSVDIVDRPATNRSFFESVVAHPKDGKMKETKTYTEQEVEARVREAVEAAKANQDTTKRVQEAEAKAEAAEKRAKEAEEALASAEAEKLLSDKLTEAKLSDAAAKEIRRRFEGQTPDADAIDAEIKALEALMEGVAPKGADDDIPPRRVDENARDTDGSDADTLQLVEGAASSLFGASFTFDEPSK